MRQTAGRQRWVTRHQQQCSGIRVAAVGGHKTAVGGTSEQQTPAWQAPCLPPLPHACERRMAVRAPVAEGAHDPP